MIHIPLSRTINNYLELKLLEHQLKKEKWTFSENRINMIHNETKDWEKYYQPINLKHKTVLDIGSGEGETARFFLKQGAREVIAIECDTIRYLTLWENAYNHCIRPFKGQFDPNQLLLKHDLCKIDIDGWESLLLKKLKYVKMPTVIEVHGHQLVAEFKKAGFQIVPGPDEWMAYAYKNCEFNE